MVQRVPVAPMASIMPSVDSVAMGTELARTVARSALCRPLKSNAADTRDTTSGLSGGTPGSRFPTEMRRPPTTSATL